MKRFLTILLVAAMCVSVIGCAQQPSEPVKPNEVQPAPVQPAAPGDAQTPSEPAEPAAKLKVVCLLNGNLGDKSFFDSSNKGMELVKNELGCETKVVEMGFDNTKWEPALLEASEQDWDIIIVGTWQMQELLQNVAPQFPEKRYIIFDSAVDYAAGGLDNVYSITFKQNDAGYLAGIVAAGFTVSGFGNTNDKPIIGAVCGMDIPVVNDFVIGYIQGASDSMPGTKVAVSYVGDFNDTAKAKEMAIAQFNLGSDIEFNVAAQAGLGIIDAAKDKKQYVVGVDADQSATFTGTDAEKEALIVTSALKNIDVSLLRAVKMHMDGTLKYGSAEMLGIAEDAVGVAKNDVFRKSISAEIIAKVEEAEAKIKSGEIKVKSAFDMSTDEWAAFKSAVAPK